MQSFMVTSADDINSDNRRYVCRYFAVINSERIDFSIKPIRIARIMNYFHFIVDSIYLKIKKNDLYGKN